MLISGLLILLVLTIFILYRYLSTLKENHSPGPVKLERIIPVIEDSSFHTSGKSEAIISQPAGMTFAGETLFVLDSADGCVRLFDKKGNLIKIIGKKGKGPGEFNRPEGICLDITGQSIIVADTASRRIQILDFEGRLKASLNLNFPPTGVAASGDRLYLLAFPGSSLLIKNEGLVKIYNQNLEPVGEFLKPATTNDISMNLLANSIILKTDRNGQLLAARQFALNEVQVFDPQGRLTRRFEIIYKGAELSPPGLDLRIQHNEDLQKLALLVLDVAFDSANNYYFLAGTSGKQPDGTLEKGREIYRYSSQGKYLGTIILPLRARLIAFSPEDELYLIDENYDLRKFILTERGPR
ncbi:MAG: 6-bladed beta-propeller [Candidatus Saccharicenans sp.]|nr:6-bladed beta-propeller [Candidatus Saccharicenans sp.]